MRGRQENDHRSPRRRITLRFSPGVIGVIAFVGTTTTTTVRHSGGGADVRRQCSAGARRAGALPSVTVVNARDVFHTAVSVDCGRGMATARQAKVTVGLFLPPSFEDVFLDRRRILIGFPLSIIRCTVSLRENRDRQSVSQSVRASCMDGGRAKWRSRQVW